MLSMYENYLHLIKQVYSQFILNAFVFICVQKTRFFSFLNLISSIAKFKLDLHNNGIIFLRIWLSVESLTSKIPKKEEQTLCMTILFFQDDVAILIPSPRWVFFCMPKTIKSIISWNEFWNETLWLFFTNKKNWWNFFQLFRVSRYKTIQTSKKKTLKQTNLLAISWMRFLGWSKNAFYSCSSQQQPIDFWLTIKR